MKNFFQMMIFFSCLFVPALASARPEYAIKEKLNCNACHAVPWGGGPRISYGKIYGAHGNQASKLSGNDLYYGDLRGVAYYPKHASKTMSGVALMQASATGNVPIFQSDNNAEIRGVLTYDIAPLSGANLREGFVRWQPPSPPSGTPNFLTLGHFYVPFGLLTDEHRAYVRMQTNMTLNNYDTGVAFSTNPNDDWHIDLVGVNDFQTGGKFSTGDVTWGAVANVRWNPASLPFFIGASGNYQHTLRYPQPFGTSLYAGLSLDRLTQDKASGSLLLERVDAKNWNNPGVNTGGINPSFSTFFIPPSDANFLASNLERHSVGYFVQAKYNLRPQWCLFYRFDYLSPDIAADDNSYARHGAGVEVYITGNLILNLRLEKAVVARPEISDSDTLAAQDDLYAVLRAWL